MKKVVLIVFFGSMLFSCNKNKCSPIDMNEGTRNTLIGTWRWHRTVIMQTFSIGDPYFYDYTPSNQEFEYYFNLTSEGVYEGYRNGELVHLFPMLHHYQTSRQIVV